MFFSAKDLHRWLHDEAEGYTKRSFEDHYGPASKAKVRKYVAAAKAGILNRDSEVDFFWGKQHEYVNDIYLGKWYRPWEIVPKLREFSVPAGDYGIGVEVEMGFTSRNSARAIANLIKNWKHIALDFEGGQHPIEVTFPPVLLSKMSSKTQVFRYLKLLRQNSSMLYVHSPSNQIGTHINVSKGGVTSFNPWRVAILYNILVGDEDLSYEEQVKYFGRRPYGGCFDQGGYIEYKLFNSTTDSKKLKQYINIAVALTDLVAGTEYIDGESVRAVLETAYNKK